MRIVHYNENMKLSSEDYTLAVKGLEEYGNALCNMIYTVLGQAGIQTLSVTHRVKTYESTLRKISSNPDKYNGIEELTDLLGVRVITYFPHDVDRVAEVLKREFIIDEKNSVDKRKLLDPDKFGYLSLHFIVTLGKSRNQLAEYKQHAKFKLEIQIRSVLQHAWAEIEHDLGYKTEGSVPDEVRRNFSRLAGLLELGDEEFERIREQLDTYEKHVEDTIDTTPQKLMLNQPTVVAALGKEKVLIDLDTVVAAAGKRGLDSNVDSDFAGRQATELKFLGVSNLEQLLKVTTKLFKHIEAFAVRWLKESSTDKSLQFRRGIGLFYLSYVLAAQKDDDELKGWAVRLRKDNPGILSKVREIWGEVIGELGKP
jgi:putative GTP pyrophosphokinase